MVKIIAIILAVAVIFTAGYIVVETIIGLFNGLDFGTAIGEALDNVWHLFGIIQKAKSENVLEFPMANTNIRTWDNTVRSW